MALLYIQGIHLNIGERPNVNRIIERSIINPPDFTGPEIIELVHFWERYPHWEANRRCAIVAAQSAPVSTLELRSIQENLSFSCPAKLIDWQLSFNGARLQGSPKIVAITINKLRVELVVTRDNGCFGEDSWSIQGLSGPTGAHTRVEHFLLREFAKRGLDGGALVQSGAICRQLCRQIKAEMRGNVITTTGDVLNDIRWPPSRSNSLYQKIFNDLSQSDREAILTAERDCIRLCSEAAAEKPLTPADAKSKFCFDEWQRGQTLKEINNALKKHPDWEHFEDEKHVRGPIKAWGKRVGIEPRSGQPGRRKQRQ